MGRFTNKGPAVTVGDVLARLGRRGRPSVRENDSPEDVVRALVHRPRCRTVYVTGSDGRLVGTISVGLLMRRMFSECFEPPITPSCLMFVITSRTAGEIMATEPLHTNTNEKIEEVVVKMVEAELQEIPVVDEFGRLVSDLTVIDLLDQRIAQRGELLGAKSADDAEPEPQHGRWPPPLNGT